MNTWTCTRQGELYHHGIKGQKWGVRRFQNKDGSLTPAGKRRYDEPNQREKSISNEPSAPKDKSTSDVERRKKIARNVAIGAAATVAGLALIGMMVYGKNSRSMSKRIGIQEIKTSAIDLSKLSNNDTILKKGTKFQRISSRSLEDFTNSGKVVYTSYLKGDNAIYMKDMPKNIASWRKNGTIRDGGKDVYRHVMRMNKDIKVASPKKVMEAYINATGNNEPKHYEYMNFMTKLVDRNDPKNQKFFSYLREAGYNALVDENDSCGYTKKPLILLDAAADVAGIKTDKVNTLNSIISVLLYSNKN